MSTVSLKEEMIQATPDEIQQEREILKEKHVRKDYEEDDDDDDVSGVDEVPGVSVMFMACIYAVEYEWCSINLLIH